MRRGSHATLRLSYAAVERHVAERGLKTGPPACEVYVGAPGTTADDDLATGIHMPLA
ncbi:hypothetical protein N1F89_11205 [Aquibium sp. A9E412]|uniref:hypothetical protein n=1 Tax=Aquibium sp. A9E412 TaxID=2976767 RepID=UPI0025B1D35D|nr:hypothetical protein [Aquibium sp. A9E412]MDN2566792.1 hypothetical protein [Aquibium sp. A9E412]